MPTPATTTKETAAAAAAVAARQKTRKCCSILIAPQEENVDTDRDKKEVKRNGLWKGQNKRLMKIKVKTMEKKTLETGRNHNLIVAVVSFCFKQAASSWELLANE